MILNLKDIMSWQKAQQTHKTAECLYTAEQVNQAIEKLAQEINQTITEEVLALVVLNGGVIFAGALLPKLTIPLQQDYIHASRYRGNLTGAGEIHFYAKPKNSLENKAILLIDDLLDEGHTLKAIANFCEANGAKKVYSVVLLDKIIDTPKADYQADFIGLSIPNYYVYGMGMDYKEYFRNLPAVYAVKD